MSTEIYASNDVQRFKPRIIIWIVSLTLIVFLIWAHFAALDEIVRGPGKVIPSSKTQVVQSLEGGILEELRVREGDEISSGSVVAKISDTKFKGAFYELENEYRALQIKLTRLSSELKKSESLVLSATDIESAPKIAESEMQLFNARRSDHEAKKVALTNAVALHDEELSLLQRLEKKGVVPMLDVIKAAQLSSDAEAELENLEGEYTLVRSEEYSETLNDIKKLEQTMSFRKDQLQRTTLKSPVRAIVNKVLINTIGGVIAPGEPILELTPLDDDLRIETKINPKDIAFVFPGMAATIKLSAYDYTIYGSFKGVVKHISADTFEEEQQKDAVPYYKVEIEVDQQTLEGSEKEISVRPGMLAEAELHVGEKTVLEYLLKPLFKTTEAFREP